MKPGFLSDSVDRLGIMNNDALSVNPSDWPNSEIKIHAKKQCCHSSRGKHLCQITLSFLLSCVMLHAASFGRPTRSCRAMLCHEDTSQTTESGGIGRETSSLSAGSQNSVRRRKSKTNKSGWLMSTWSKKMALAAKSPSM